MNEESLKKETGYSLLEIIVVITLLGLTAGIVIPRLSNIYNSFQWANERDDVFRRISMLGYSAFKERRNFELKEYPASDSVLPLELPEGWRIKAESPIRYKSNGICLGGKLLLTHGETSILLNLKPPHCRPD